MIPPPFFSIIIPTYNRAHLIKKTIESVLAQEFDDFEVLVIDDGSNDDTEEVVRQISDARLSYFKRENAERGAARNFGFGRSRGTYVNFFDSDDLMYSNHLKVAHELVNTYGKPKWFHLGYDFMLPDGTVTKRVNDFNDSVSQVVLFDNKLSCNGVFVNREVAESFPFVEDRVLASAEDWELWIRLACRYKLAYSNEITSTVVNHEQRSIRTIPSNKLVARDLFFIEKLKEDREVMNYYGRSFGKFVAERFTFFMLSFSEERNSSQVWRWAMRAFRAYPQILGDRRFLASIKNTIRK
jgi:glycosyltransferase involved in cell wall biosynthesis